MQTEPKQMDVLPLAFLGDAVWELFVRKRILQSSGAVRADRLHREAVRYVSAAPQAKVVKTMLESGFFTEEEEALIKRAHNHKIATKPRNADPVTYKWATAFEALLGLLDLSGSKERLQETVSRAFEIIEQHSLEDTEKQNA